MTEIKNSIVYDISTRGGDKAKAQGKSVIDAISGPSALSAMQKTSAAIDRVETSIAKSNLSAKELRAELSSLRAHAQALSSLTRAQREFAKETREAARQARDQARAIRETENAAARAAAAQERQARVQELEVRRAAAFQAVTARPQVVAARLATGLPPSLAGAMAGRMGMGAIPPLEGFPMTGAVPPRLPFAALPPDIGTGDFPGMPPPGGGPPGGEPGGGGGGALLAALPIKRVLAVATLMKLFGAATRRGISAIPAHMQLLEEIQRATAAMSPVLLGEPQAAGAGVVRRVEPGARELRAAIDQRQSGIEQALADFGYDAQRSAQIQNELLMRGGGFLEDLPGGNVRNAAAALRLGIPLDVSGAFRFAERRGAFGVDTGTQQDLLREFLHLASRMGFEGPGETVPLLQEIAGILDDFRKTGISTDKEGIKDAFRTAAMFGPLMGANVAGQFIRTQRATAQQGPQSLLGMFQLRAAFESLGIDPTKGISARDYERALNLMARGGGPGALRSVIDQAILAGGGVDKAGTLQAGDVLGARSAELTAVLRLRAGRQLAPEEADVITSLQQQIGRRGEARRDFERRLIEDPEIIEKLARASVEAADRRPFSAGQQAPLVQQAINDTKQVVDLAENLVTITQSLGQAARTFNDDVMGSVQSALDRFARLLDSIVATRRPDMFQSVLPSDN